MNHTCLGLADFKVNLLQSLSIDETGKEATRLRSCVDVYVYVYILV